MEYRPTELSQQWIGDGHPKTSLLFHRFQQLVAVGGLDTRLTHVKYEKCSSALASVSDAFELGGPPIIIILSGALHVNYPTSQQDWAWGRAKPCSSSCCDRARPRGLCALPRLLCLQDAGIHGLSRTRDRLKIELVAGDFHKRKSSIGVETLGCVR